MCVLCVCILRFNNVPNKLDELVFGRLSLTGKANLWPNKYILYPRTQDKNCVTTFGLGFGWWFVEGINKPASYIPTVRTTDHLKVAVFSTTTLALSLDCGHCYNLKFLIVLVW